MPASLDGDPDSPTARRTLSIGVIGTGRLGAALAGALLAAGYRDVTLSGRSEAHVRAAAASLNLPALRISDVVERCALVFLAVPDHAIAALGETLSWRPGQGVVHHSGALELTALRGATARGALAGCLHPLQTFPGGVPTAATSADLFRGIACGVEGAPPLDVLLPVLAGDLGARALPLGGVDRALYHAAAVLVSNDVVALMAAAGRAWTLAGLDAADAQAALAPLLRAAAANAAGLPLPQALTGPIARGDTGTVERHVRALEADPALLTLYRALGRELLRLDLGLSPEVGAELRALLRES